MRYGETVYLEPIDSKVWKALKDSVKIYELKLPPYTKIKTLLGKTAKWKAGKQLRSMRWNYSIRDKVDIWEVVGVWANPKNTVKVILAGKGYGAIFSKTGRPHGFTSLKWQRYGDKVPDIFDNIKVGTFLCVDESGRKDLLFACNEPTLIDVAIVLNGLTELYNKHSERSEFKWQSEQYELPTYGTVSKAEVQIQRRKMALALRNFTWLKRKDTWDLMNAVKANLTVKNDGTDLKVKIKALDGNTYTVETPVIEKEDEKNIGWQDHSLFKMDYWLPFVYRDSNDHFLQYSNAQKTEELFRDLFLRIPLKVPESRIILGFNRRRVVITRKKTASKALLNYLDGKIVRAEDIDEKLKNYFIFGKPIAPAPPKTPKSLLKKPQKRKQILSQDAQRLIAEGLTGQMRDLEGEFPFRLNCVYKEKERKWYLEIAGKEFYIKGGYNALKKVRSAIAGTAITNRDKEGWDGRATKAIRYRLGELVGDKNALWIIIHVKKMGALYKVMGAN